jgi:anti-sigma regulatory factor (Ser/Thr protein kinase)
MVANSTDQALDRLSLRSHLSEMSRLPRWLESLASRHDIPDEVQFAIDLCLEEAVSNVIRHGYAGAEDRSVTVVFVSPRTRYFEFLIEDEAPHFDPLAAPALEAISPEQAIRVGGQGIRLLRQFADSVEYESTTSGNRLRIGFSADRSNGAK